MEVGGAGVVGVVEEAAGAVGGGWDVSGTVLGAGVLRAEAFEAGRVWIAEDPGQEADDGVEDDEGGALAAGEDVVADGELAVAEEVVDALIDAFVAAAEKDDAVKGGELGGDGLGERTALRGEEDDGLAGGGAEGETLGLGREMEGFDAVEDGLGLEDHALPAAEGTVVDGAVAVVGEGAEILRVDLHETGTDGTGDDAVIERAGEEGGKDGEEIEAHELGAGERDGAGQFKFSGGSGLWTVQVEEAGGESHVDAAGSGIDGEDEALDVRDEHFVTHCGYYREERRHAGEAAAIGGGGKLDGIECADEAGAVEDLAAEEVVDVLGSGFELEALGGGDEDVEAGEEFGLGDGIDTGQGEDDAPEVLAGGEPEAGDVGGASAGSRTVEARRGEEDTRMLLKVVGQIGEEIGQQLALASLGPKQMCQGSPCRGLAVGHEMSIRSEAGGGEQRGRLRERLSGHVPLLPGL
jgi:hypothetical protein